MKHFMAGGDSLWRGSLTAYIKLWLAGPGISKAIRKVIAGWVVCQKNSPETDLHRNKGLSDAAQWVGRHLTKQSLTASLPSQGTRLGCRPGV